MTYPFSQRNFDGGGRFVSAQFRPERLSGPTRVILVAVNSNALPPIFHQETVLQRMRVLSVPPDELDDLEPANLLPGAFQRPLPPMPRGHASLAQRARLVHGEILHDNQGRMYEKTGNTIRALQHLVAGAQGQVFELYPSNAPRPDLEDAEAHVDPENSEGEQQREQSPDATDAPRFSSAPSQWRAEREPSPRAQASEAVFAAPYRKLFADPGLPRLVRFGDFKALLAPQLIHPERLRDSHWIRCFLQVYEARAAQPMESLAAAVLGDAELARQLQFLTDGLARRLDLAQLITRRPPSTAMRRPGDVLPNDRVFRLQVESDPTADHAPLHNDNRTGKPAAAHWTSSRAPGDNAPEKDSIKKAIPERMIKPWEFRISREEALYDMNVAKPFGRFFTSLARSLKAFIGGGSEMKKWRLLLSGKSAEEQLWGVRPPSGGVSHAAIREWARRTLEAAGYDSQTMLLEWEIFWRRKGV